MTTFTKNSKPKVLCIGVPILPDDRLEIISVDSSNILEIIRLNPDLILTDKRKRGDYPYLSTASVYLREKWIEIVPNQEIDLYHQAMIRILSGTQVIVSFFTSTFNTGKKIMDTYKSLYEQTNPNWEWVIVDDSNDTNTLPILKTLSEADERVKLYSFYNKSGGVIGEAKYRAAMLCTGKVIAELDHDDILVEDCAELLESAYYKYPECGFYYSDCVELSTDGTSLTYGEGFAFGYGRHYEAIYKGKTYIASEITEINQKTIRHIVSVPNHIRAWRADVYREIGGHNRCMRIADDYELIVRTFLKTKFLHIPKLLYLQIFDGNNSQDKSGARADIQLKVYEVANYYSHLISKRINELGFPDKYFNMHCFDIYNSDNDNLNKLEVTYEF
jgi:glycosyltransferase involved in cell wall biosynthesis